MDSKTKPGMKFVAWYCHKCKMYFREIELHGGRCPECGGVAVPQPMVTKGTVKGGDIK